MQETLAVSVVRLLLTGVSVFIVAKVLPGMRVKSYGSAVFFALMVAVLNAVAWHFFAILTYPIAILTFGIGGLVINGIIFLIADKIVEGVEISGCITAIVASVGVTAVNWLMHLFVGQWAP